MTTSSPPVEEQQRPATSPGSVRPRVGNNALRVATIAGILVYLDWTWLLDQGHRAVAVQSPEGSLLGLATLADLRQVRQEDWRTTPVSQIVTPAARLQTVPPTEDLRGAIGVLATEEYHQLPVIEQGHLVGLLDRDPVMQ
jgi:CBS domain-containing protein